MAHFKDWTGWMATTEEVEPDSDVEKEALRKLILISDDPEEVAEVATILGIIQHLPAVQQEMAEKK